MIIILLFIAISITKLTEIVENVDNTRTRSLLKIKHILQFLLLKTKTTNSCIVFSPSYWSSEDLWFLSKSDILLTYVYTSSRFILKGQLLLNIPLQEYMYKFLNLNFILSMPTYYRLCKSNIWAFLSVNEGLIRIYIYKPKKNTKQEYIKLLQSFFL